MYGQRRKHKNQKYGKMRRRGDGVVPGLRALLATMLRTPGVKKCVLFLGIVGVAHFLSALGSIISNRVAKS
jgi:hypothetical protein